MPKPKSKAAGLPKHLSEELVAAAVTARMLDGGGKAYQLPLISVIPDTAEMQRALEILKRAEQVQVSISALEAELKSSKEELSAIALGADLPGFRHGDLYVMVNTQTRTSLDKMKLVELGVSIDTIGAAMKESEPFYTVKVGRMKS